VIPTWEIGLEKVSFGEITTALSKQTSSLSLGAPGCHKSSSLLHYLKASLHNIPLILMLSIVTCVLYYPAMPLFGECLSNLHQLLSHPFS